MKKYMLLLGAIVCLTSFSQLGTITVKVNAIKNNNGSMLLYLYRDSNGYPTDPKKAWKSAKATISGNTCVYKFENLPFGNYAISVVHDENGNCEMDTNFMGIPKEGTGASNNAKGSFGPPKFSDAQFTHQQNSTALDIKINY